MKGSLCGRLTVANRRVCALSYGQQAVTSTQPADRTLGSTVCQICASTKGQYCLDKQTAVNCHWYRLENWLELGFNGPSHNILLASTDCQMSTVQAGKVSLPGSHTKSAEASTRHHIGLHSTGLMACLAYVSALLCFRQLRPVVVLLLNHS